MICNMHINIINRYTFARKKRQPRRGRVGMVTEDSSPDSMEMRDIPNLSRGSYPPSAISSEDLTQMVSLQPTKHDPVS